MKHHVLKCWPEHFEAIGEKRKTFEVRKNDRDFQEGDTCELREFIPCRECAGGGVEYCYGGNRVCEKCKGEKGEYTYRWIFCRIGTVVRGSFGLKPDYCVWSVLLPKNHQWPIPTVAQLKGGKAE